MTEAQQPLGYNENQAERSVPQEVAPTPLITNKIRRITIVEVSRGYVVDVGCQTYAIETKAQLISKLSEYINEPEKTEQKWFKNELF